MVGGRTAGEILLCMVVYCPVQSWGVWREGERERERERGGGAGM